MTRAARLETNQTFGTKERPGKSAGSPLYHPEAPHECSGVGQRQYRGGLADFPHDFVGRTIVLGLWEVLGPLSSEEGTA